MWFTVPVQHELEKAQDLVRHLEERAAERGLSVDGPCYRLALQVERNLTCLELGLSQGCALSLDELRFELALQERENA